MQSRRPMMIYTKPKSRWKILKRSELNAWKILKTLIVRRCSRQLGLRSKLWTNYLTDWFHLMTVTLWLSKTKHTALKSSLVISWHSEFQWKMRTHQWGLPLHIMIHRRTVTVRKHHPGELEIKVWRSLSIKRRKNLKKIDVNNPISHLKSSSCTQLRKEAQFSTPKTSMSASHLLSAYPSVSKSSQLTLKDIAKSEKRKYMLMLITMMTPHATHSTNYSRRWIVNRKKPSPRTS